MKLRRRKPRSEPATPATLVALRSIQSRQRETERTTRRPLPWWDRVKWLTLLAGLFVFYWWRALDENPIKSVADGFWETVQDRYWIVGLVAVELLRQLHFAVAEHWGRYYRFWRNSVFGRVERRIERVDPWTRFRVGRVAKLVVTLVVASVITGQLTGTSPFTALVSLPGRFADALPLVFRLLFYFLFVIVQFVGLFWFLSRGGTEVYFPDDIETRFDNVWGQDSVLDKIRENLIFLENPEAIESRGGYTPGGILLWGPPGTGKTLLAEAAAGETGKPFVFVEPGAFINMFMGVGILKVKSLFRKLRRLSLRYGGVVVFFDEADALGSRGAGVGGFQSTNFGRYLADSTVAGSCHPYLSSGAQQALWEAAVADHEPTRQHRDGIVMNMGGGGGGTLQALLTELSGLKKPRGFFNRTVRKALGMRPKPPPTYRILVMLATNMPDSLDPAMLRPGRIDRIYKVGYPTKEGRKRTYEGYLAKVRHDLTPEQIDRLALITPYATGAIIKDTVNEGLINAIRDGREVITWSDIIKAKQLKSHGMADDFEYVEHERHHLAIHEACHAVVAQRLRSHFVIDIATIERRGGVGGFVSSIPAEDRFTHWRSEYEKDIQVSLASLAGERLFFEGDNSSGVGGDLRSATQLCTMMTGYWGMGATLSSHAVSRQHGIGGGRRRPDEEPEDDQQRMLEGDLGARIEQQLGLLYDEVRALLEENRLEVLAVAHALEHHRTITGEDVVAIVEGTEGPLLDGGGYYTPDAAAALERYHEKVLASHRRGEEVLPELPAIAGVTDRVSPPVDLPSTALAGAAAGPA